MIVSKTYIVLMLLSYKIPHSLQATATTQAASSTNHHSIPSVTAVPRKYVVRRRWQKSQLAIIELEVCTKIESNSCRWTKTEVEALRQRIGPEPLNLRQKINEIQKQVHALYILPLP